MLTTRPLKPLNKLISRPLILTCNTFLSSILNFRFLVALSLILKISYRLMTNCFAETEIQKRGYIMPKIIVPQILCLYHALCKLIKGKKISLADTSEKKTFRIQVFGTDYLSVSGTSNLSHFITTTNPPAREENS
jgi:hypothetical protein